jgi:hypothetical protein
MDYFTYIPIFFLLCLMVWFIWVYAEISEKIQKRRADNLAKQNIVLGTVIDQKDKEITLLKNENIMLRGKYESDK